MNKQHLSEEERLALALGTSIINGLRDTGIMPQANNTPQISTQLDSNVSQKSPLLG